MNQKPRSANLQQMPEMEFRKEDWPFYWITQAAAGYEMILEDKLKVIGLDPSYWRILMTLYEHQRLSVAEISQYCIIKPNTATKIIQRMLAEGLVMTGVRETDARVTEVSCTKHGNELRQKARAVAETIFEKAFLDLSAEEQMILNIFLGKITKRLKSM